MIENTNSTDKRPREVPERERGAEPRPSPGFPGGGANLILDTYTNIFVFGAINYLILPTELNHLPRKNIGGALISFRNF